jgi:hypothetical protein
MSLFTFIKEWGSNLNQVAESDRIFTHLTGINLKGYHPTIYRSGIDIAQEFQDKTVGAGGNPLTSHEFAIIRIAVIAAVADSAEDFSVAQKCIDAIGRLKRTCPNEAIRRNVIWHVEDDICKNIRVYDSNPDGNPN